ncbi:MAG: MBL fold metallo-hydrolase [Deltaproteobacteria bacterium]|nr:MBL fold metallo-hydrolase [Deltaproteobacteria bacterium]
MAHVPSKLRKKIEWLFRRAEGRLLPSSVREAEGKHLDPDGAYMALVASHDDVAILGEEATARLAALQANDRGAGSLSDYLSRYGLCGVRAFTAGGSGGAPPATIYQLAIETFPRHVNNLYVVCTTHEGARFVLLLDAGSGLPSSRRDLALAFAVLRATFEEPVRWEELDWCVVSHAHSDHCGGVNVLRSTSRAKLAVHELDARVISGFDERLVLASKDLELYWRRAGVPAEQRAAMRDMYMAGKQLFRSERVDRVLKDGDTIGPGFVVHHVPGHCPGLVCLQIHDVLLTSDHVLARITPHQFPQAITPFAGLEHYFRSLEKIRGVSGIRLALGGHEEPILDLRARIDEIEAFHRERLERVLEVCGSPRSVHEVALALFGERSGYDVILAIDEAGAHVEYLHQLGRLRVDNLAEVRELDDPVFRYVARSAATPVA